VQWSPFLMRNDGTSLDPADISGYKVFADTLPSPTTLRMQVPHPASSALLTGLESCKSWYVNLLCVDACGHDGDYIPSAAVPVLLTAGCEPGNPASPPSLTLVPLDTRIQLEWPANTTDCDLSGYRIYYGTTSGVYDGVDAAEGPSPVEVASPVVTLGSVCRFELTGLPTCVPYHVAVAAYDACSPPNVSPLSPEANGTTTCIACEVADACLGWATGPSNTQVNLEVYTGSSGGETITRLTPTWSGGALLQSVWYGRPLTAIWASDGSAGEDGPVGPRPSGTELNLADVSVPSWSGEGHGEPLRLVFSADMRGVPLELSFRGTSGVCTAGGTVTEAAVFDDWNDGDYTGWTKTGGTWSVSGGQLNQTATSNSYVLYKDGFSSGSQTIEAKVKVVGGTGHSAYIVFRGTDASNYWVFGIRTDQDRVRVARIRAGAWYSELAYANLTLVDNQWYSLRVVIEGTRVRGWVDCEPVIDANSSYIPLTGKAGLSTRNANASFEDVRIYGATVLP